MMAEFSSLGELCLCFMTGERYNAYVYRVSNHKEAVRSWMPHVLGWGVLVFETWGPIFGVSRTLCTLITAVYRDPQCGNCDMYHSAGLQKLLQQTFCPICQKQPCTYNPGKAHSPHSLPCAHCVNTTRPRFPWRTLLEELNGSVCVCMRESDLPMQVLLSECRAYFWWHPHTGPTSVSSHVCWQPPFP